MLWKGFQKPKRLEVERETLTDNVVDLDIKDRRIDEGMAKVRRFLAHDPGNVSWHQDLARLALARGRDEEIASVIVFLCSERASYVTGAAWSADGGTVPIIL